MNIYEMHEDRIKASRSSMMDAMDADLCKKPAVYVLVVKLPKRRWGLTIMLEWKATVVKQRLPTVYPTRREAMKAALAAEEGARMVHRQASMPLNELAGAEQAIGWTQTDYAAKIGLSIPSEDGKVQPL